MQKSKNTHWNFSPQSFNKKQKILFKLLNKRIKMFVY